MTESIVYTEEGKIGRMVLNLPERHNALGKDQLHAIQEVLDAIVEDNVIRVLVVTGAGEKTFCAGAALDELSAGNLDNELFQITMQQLAYLPIPTVCALNGNVFGGGVELAASCDFRIGVEGTRMRVPAAALGLCYPIIGIERFVECVGTAAARRILVASEEFDAEQMLAMNFLDHLVHRSALNAKTDQIAGRLAGLAPLAVRGMKSILRNMAAGAFNTNEGAAWVKRCANSKDLQEGFAAQREKRIPNFVGA